MSVLMIKDSPNCSICFEPARSDSENPDQRRVYTACKHIFHRACLETWLKRKDNCPVCRFVNPHPDRQGRASSVPRPLAAPAGRESNFMSVRELAFRQGGELQHRGYMAPNEPMREYGPRFSTARESRPPHTQTAIEMEQGAPQAFSLEAELERLVRRSREAVERISEVQRQDRQSLTQPMAPLRPFGRRPTRGPVSLPVHSATHTCLYERAGPPITPPATRSFTIERIEPSLSSYLWGTNSID